MPNKIRFPFVAADGTLSDSSLRPLLPITLTSNDHSVEAMGLLDTGAMVNVMPYQIGLALGAIWEQQTVFVQLTGNLAQLEARGLIVQASVAQSSPVQLAFAWTQAENIPLILGQVNFFMAFDVCFYRAQGFFELMSR